jgi:hypothetical protein
MHGPRWLFALALGFASMSSAAAQEATPSRKPVVPGAEREIAVSPGFRRRPLSGSASGSLQCCL